MNYSNIINSILNDKILSLEEKFMLISLKNLDKYGDNIVGVGYETLMRYLDTNRKAKISSILKSLKEKEYIDWKRCGRKENEYRFIKDYLITEVGTGTFEGTSSSKNETLNKIKSSESEILSYDENSKNETSSFYSSSEDVISKNNINSKNETIETNNNFTNRTFSYDASSKFGTVNEVYSNENRTLNSNHINSNNKLNNNNINNTNIWVYKEIFELWNSKGINDVGELTNNIINDIRKAITVYGVEKIKKGIENYSKVFHSDYYYNHQWSLSTFLTRPNGIGKFIDGGEIWTKYKKQYETLDDQYEKYGINIEDYINS